MKIVILAFSLLTGLYTLAQPGSPFATESLHTRYLPQIPGTFKGIINFNVSNSKSYWHPSIVPPAGAPNILLIMTDDVGYGAPSTFGGSIPTLALDRVAHMGLRYTQFHSTALCSPTRAALITGRNHHSAHSGVIQEIASGFPGYDSIIGKDTATLGEILKQNGYATSWFGKNHNTPDWMASQAGPFDNWPVGYGFEYFYGFLGGDTSQWHPHLFRNTTPIEPYAGKRGWNLTTAMADDAIQHIKTLHAIDPSKSFFVYYAPGGTHAPHHPTPEWIKKFKGKFDHGWNVERERIFARQKKLGVIPAHAQLTPWPDSIPKWDILSQEEKKLFARQAEVYAAYLAYTDHEIGRVIDSIEKMGKLEDTLIIYISGDNGCSPEGTLTGTPNEIAIFNGVTIPVKEQMKFYDEWGSDKTYPHMAVGWAWAFDTPFKWTKQIASHFGGTRQGLAISWPRRIKDAGGIRTQFHHVIDIAPTILEATHIPAPYMVNGVAQKPIEGTSMAYSWDKKNAKLPSHRKTQYFEMLGNRAIFHDGWIASTTPPQVPWLFSQNLPTDVMNGYAWELYNLHKDPTQYTDLATKLPDKLRFMKELFTAEASKYQVFPLNNGTLKQFAAERPSPAHGRNTFSYSGTVAGIPHGAAPNLLNTSYTITATVEVPHNAHGMLVKQGGRFGGYGFYLVKGVPIFTWNLLDLQRINWRGNKPLTAGKHTLTFDFTYDGDGLGRGGLGVLKVDGKEVARRRMQKTIPFILQWDETFDVGIDSGTSVNDAEYSAPFCFKGKINDLTIQLRESPLNDKDKSLFLQKGQRNNQASE